MKFMLVNWNYYVDHSKVKLLPKLNSKAQDFGLGSSFVLFSGISWPCHWVADSQLSHVSPVQVDGGRRNDVICILLLLLFCHLTLFCKVHYMVTAQQQQQQQQHLWWLTKWYYDDDTFGGCRSIWSPLIFDKNKFAAHSTWSPNSTMRITRSTMWRLYMDI